MEVLNLIVGLGNPDKIFQKNRKKRLTICHFLDFGLLTFCAELKFWKSSNHDFFISQLLDHIFWSFFHLDRLFFNFRMVQCRWPDRLFLNSQKLLKTAKKSWKFLKNFVTMSITIGINQSQNQNVHYIWLHFIYQMCGGSGVCSWLCAVIQSDPNVLNSRW